MKIGVFGGTFDPPHIQHVALATRAIELLELDKLYIIPSAVKFFHDDAQVTPCYDRLEMTKLAFNHLPHVVISDISIKANGFKYAIDVLRQLHKENGENDQFWWILGADILPELHMWKESDKLIEYCRIAAFPRLGYDLYDGITSLPISISEGLDVLDIKAQSESSSEIKQLIAQNEDVSQHVPSSVMDYIRAKSLYGFSSFRQETTS